ncbi:MAG: SWF/SNF helicase family protein [Candidatus Binatia bacterium]|nr:SWF/SNF helicase family protein [Candidatus Binatia bacterium]
MLHRRLASSPEAIYRSLQRRRRRLEQRLKEAKQHPARLASGAAALDDEVLDSLEDDPEGETQDNVREILDQATAAQSIAELEAEIATSRRLEGEASELRARGEDTKWCELATVIEALVSGQAAIAANRSDAAFFGELERRDGESLRPKLIVFTEFRDTLEYLVSKIEERWPGRVIAIHGGITREKRLQAQQRFASEPRLQVLVATDAAGEGINLQCAHLMVNYDLPWNPNRIDQRFGRIHRIVQTRPCFLWNLVAEQTCEGRVYATLLVKIAEIQRALGGKVFDVLGKLQFDGKPLRELLLEAVRRGHDAAVEERLERTVTAALDLGRIRDLVEDRALVRQVIDAHEVQRLSAGVQRARATRLNPFATEAWFVHAFEQLGGKIHRRDVGVYELELVPAQLRQRARSFPGGAFVQRSYPRVTFRQEIVGRPGRRVELLHLGHPLVRAVADLVLEQHGSLLRVGSVLVDDRDETSQPRVVFGFRHSVVDGMKTQAGERRTISQRFLFVEIDSEGHARTAGRAPHLNARPLAEGEPGAAEILASPECSWILGAAARPTSSRAPGESTALEKTRSPMPRMRLPSNIWRRLLRIAVRKLRRCAALWRRGFAATSRIGNNGHAS